MTPDLPSDGPMDGSIPITPPSPVEIELIAAMLPELLQMMQKFEQMEQSDEG